MTRYVIIALMNLLVVASIAGNAIVALVRGCNMDGTCSNGSGVLTWVLGVGLGLAVIIGGAMLFRYARKQYRASTSQRISIPSLPGFARASADHEETQAGEEGDEAMLSRLARMARATAADSQDIDAERGGDETPDCDDRLVEEPIESADEGWNVVEDFAPPAPIADLAPADLHLVVRDGERTEPRPDRAEIDVQVDEAPDGRFDWLFDDHVGNNLVQIRRDTGFPWSVAGIDHVCRGVSRFGSMLVGTDVASEAAAWCQVTASLRRGEPLTSDDSLAFTDWLNAGLHLIGRSGGTLIEDAMHALDAEAARDPAVARCLPHGFWADDRHDHGRIMRFG